jgi:hypothetical protein
MGMMGMRKQEIDMGGIRRLERSGEQRRACDCVAYKLSGHEKECKRCERIEGVVCARLQVLSVQIIDLAHRLKRRIHNLHHRLLVPKPNIHKQSQQA